MTGPLRLKNAGLPEKAVRELENWAAQLAQELKSVLSDEDKVSREALTNLASRLTTNFQSLVNGFAIPPVSGSPDSQVSTLSTQTGTVQSVALSAPSIFTIAGSPVTGTGTLSFSLNTQTANAVFAGPTSGSASAPTFRALDARDFYAVAPALLASVSVNLNITSAQDLYTVPAGKTLVALIAVFRAPSVNISGVALGLDIRDNSANVFWTFDNSGLTGNTKFTSALLGDNSVAGLGTLVTATNKVQAKCASAFGSAATATIDLFGYVF